MKKMRKIVLIALAVASLASCTKEKEVDYTVLSGTVANVGAMNKMMVRGGDGFKEEITLAADGTFLDTLKIPMTGYYALVMGRDGMYVYLEKGDNLKISADANSFSEAVKYEAGKTKDINSYLILKSKNKGQLMQKLGGSQLFMQPQDRFLTLMDSIKNLDLDFLKTQKGLASEFVKLETKKINYEYLTNVVRFPRYYSYFNRGAELEQSEAMKKIIASIDYSNAEDYDKLAGYKQMVLSHFIGEFSKEGADKKVVINTIKNNGIPKLSNDFAKALSEGITPGAEDVKETIEFINTLTNDKEILESVNKKMAQVELLAKGKPSPNFTEKDINGKEVSLSDLKGNLVYIDVWATWCGPCKREIPSLLKLEEKYHGKAIKFISMSVDTADKKADWEKMIADKKMGGIQIMATDNWKNPFVVAYGIRSIPRFILIDKEGNIVSADAPRPSSGEEIEKLLDENLK